MGTKITVTSLSSGFNGTDIDQNFTDLADEFDNVVYRDGTSPNTMEADLDLNSNRIRNLAQASTNSDAATLQDVLDLTTEDATTKPASAITVSDSSGYYASGTVEGVLAEIIDTALTFTANHTFSGDPNFTGTPTKSGSELASSGGGNFPNVDANVTATDEELNKLDGVTATTAELNKLDGVTATTAELNNLDGVTRTAAELNSGWIHLANYDLTGHGSSSIDFTDGFGENYKAIRFVFRAIKADENSGTGAQMRILFSNDGGSTFRDTSGDYGWGAQSITEAGSSESADDDASYISFLTTAPSDQDNGSYVITVDVFDADNTGRFTTINWQGFTYTGQTNAAQQTVGGACVLTEEANDAMRFLNPSSNNITEGEVDVWAFAI